MKKIFLTAAVLCGVSGLWAQTARDGQYVAILTNTSVNETGTFVPDTGLDINDNLTTVTPGETLVASFNARTAGATPGKIFRANLAFFENANATNHLGDFNVVGATLVPFEWTTYTANITVPPNANYFNFAIRADATTGPINSIMIDNVSVIGANSTQLMANGSFENWPGDADEPPAGWRFFPPDESLGNVRRYVNPPLAASTNELTQLFKIDADTNGWFLGQPNPAIPGTLDHLTRGMGYNQVTGNLLVADRSSGTSGTVYILNGLTGTQLGTLNMDGVNPANANFIINKVAVDDSGRIFVCNLVTATGANTTFRIYSWPNEVLGMTTPPTLAYEAVVGERFGDDIDAIGSGANTRIVVSGRLNLGTMLTLEDPENDGTFAATSLPLPGHRGPYNVAYSPDGNIVWHHRSMGSVSAPQADNMPIVPFDAETGEEAGDPYEINALYPMGGFDVANLDGTTIMAIAPAEAEFGTTTTGVRGFIYNLNDNTLPPSAQTGLLERTGGFIPNGNGASDAIIDPVARRVYFMVTNNSISGWSLGTSTVREWSLH